jgi:hypothetical protein
MFWWPTIWHQVLSNGVSSMFKNKKNKKINTSLVQFVLHVCVTTTKYLLEMGVFYFWRWTLQPPPIKGHG